MHSLIELTGNNHDNRISDIWNGGLVECTVE